MAESEDPPTMIASVIDGRYRVDQLIATGAMGEVYLGVHLKLKKRVAIKVLRHDAKNHPELLLRFEREALAGAQISSPHVASATDFGDLPDSSQYLVMEYVRGTTLRAALDKDKPMATTRAVRIARQIAVALEEIHRRGIVHRDLKPRNVMLSTEDFVKVVDFGLAKVDDARLSTFTPDVSEVEEEERLTGQGVIMGTVEYLAPEAAFGMELVDHRADLYALGVMLYEMLAGRHPFEGRTEGEIFAKHRHQVPKPLSVHGVAVPKAVEDAVMRLMEKDFDARFQSAESLIAELDAALPEGRNTPAPPEEPALSSTAKPSLPVPAAETPVEKEAEEPKSAAQEAKDAAPPSGTAIPKKTPSTAKEGLKNEPAQDVSKPLPSPVSRGAWALWGGALLLSLSALVAIERRPPQRSAPPVKPSAMPEVPSNKLDPVAPVPPTSSAAPQPTSSASSTPAAEAIDIETLARAVKEKAGDEVQRLVIAVARDPAGLSDAHRARITLSALTLLSSTDHPSANDAFRAVARAPMGPDALYRYLETKGTSREAERTRALFEESEIARGMSPALRVAALLRTLPCDKKLDLLDEAVREGDARAIRAIDIVVRGCVKNPRAVDEALKKLKARLAKR
jgi:eukaryotic-like serine/threonine-protein kinase